MVSHVVHGNFIQHTGNSATDILRNLKLANINRPVIAHLNINSIRNKIEALKLIIGNNIDILLVSETKLDDSFLTAQFAIQGYSAPFRLDKNGRSGGLLFYVRDHILKKEIKGHMGNGIEGILLEINFRNKKWLLFGGYNCHKTNTDRYLSTLGHILDSHVTKYDNFLIMGDFNSEPHEKSMEEFCSRYTLQNLVKGPTCVKNPLNPSLIDLILSNKPRSFLKTITVETGISDHHLMTVTVLRSYIPKQGSTCIVYRDFNKFNSRFFAEILSHNLLMLDRGDMRHELFRDIVMKLLNIHAPLKKKFVRANQGPFMSKTFSKACMTRSRLRNKYLRTPSEENKINFKKQRNFCVNLLKREKKAYYSSLNTKLVLDNKKFWKTVSPLFSEKHKISEKITLIEGDTIISDDSQVAETFNAHFSNATAKLDIKGYPDCLSVPSHYDSINGAIHKFSLHPSVLKIRENIKVSALFNFSLTDVASIASKIRELDITKPTTFNSIPAKILYENKDTCALYICKMVNDSILHCEFPASLKNADIIPGHKKDERTRKNNYRPVSILPSVSKIYERTMEEQILTYMKPKLSSYLCGFRKGYSAQNCLLVLQHLWNIALDRNHLAGAFLTDLSKAFDCLNHELLIAKLDAYGFDYNALAYIYSYLTGRRHRTKVNNSLSSWADILAGMAQGSILGPPLFNIYINDIFFFIDEKRLANYADDNTPFSISPSLDTLLNDLKCEVVVLNKWFNDNYFMMNADKCKLLVTKHSEGTSLTINEELIKGSKSVKLLGVTLDNKLEFNEHVAQLCSKVSKKVHALARISPFMDTANIRKLMKAFIESQFSYCPLVWMFHNRTLNNRINHLHERALRITYKNPKLTFEELLDLDNSFTIHHRNLQKLAVELYKVIHNLAPGPMNDIFKLSSNECNVRDKMFITSNIHSVLHGTETIAFRAAKLWPTIPPEIRNTTSLSTFQHKIRQWKPIGCLCRLCRPYIKNLGFL